MAEKPIDYSKLLAIVNQVMGICIQTNARSAALESLLIDKGLVTEAELNARTQQLAENEKRLSDGLGSSGKENVS
jgi:hypothetical protein